MVVINDFEFQIVTAEEKVPFKEHQNGLNTYVEVEPDAEYFLSVRKVRSSSTDCLVMLEIDGKFLGYAQPFPRHAISKMSLGIYSRSKGVDIHKALKFVKASFTSADMGIGSTMAGMGKIELKVHHAIPMGRSRLEDVKSSSFAASTINSVDKARVTMKKNLRSGEGHSIEAEQYDSNALYQEWRTGAHLYTITLYYCATPGLIAVGVLSKPPLWDYHRMLKPATAEQKVESDKNVVSAKRTREGNEILEFNETDDDDSDSDTDEDTEHDENLDQALSKQKKPRIELSNDTIRV